MVNVPVTPHRATMLTSCSSGLSTGAGSAFGVVGGTSGTTLARINSRFFFCSAPNARTWH